MSKQKEQQVIYYTDEVNEEFASDGIKPIPIDSTYKYGDNSLWWRFRHFVFYRIVAVPLAWNFLKLKYHHKIVGRNVLKGYQKKGFFVFGNHTNNMADALIPTFVSWPKHVYVIVHPNNVSIPVLGQSTKFLGAVPLPDNLAATKNFMNVLKVRMETNKAVCIYPEAHIWPFYTKIRPFSDASFRYPIQYKVPSFCFTNTYQKRAHSETPQIVTYVDGPFFPDESLPPKERKTELRNRIYEKMCERSKMSNVEVIKYIKKETEKND